MDEHLIGVDKEGRPIVYQNFRNFTAEKIFAITEDDWIWHYAYKCEVMIHVIFPICSKMRGMRIDQMDLLVDVGTTSLSVFLSSKVRSYKGKGFNVGNFCYPEILGKTWIINAPWLFSAIWTFAKMFIDKKTQEKISIMGSGAAKELLKYIDPEVLPKFLGGDRDLTIEDMPKEVYPWTAYWDYCIEKKSWFHYQGQQGSDPWLQAQTKIFDIERIEKGLATRELKPLKRFETLEASYTEIDDEPELVYDNDDAYFWHTDEGLSDLHYEALRSKMRSKGQVCDWEIDWYVDTNDTDEGVMINSPKPMKFDSLNESKIDSPFQGKAINIATWTQNNYGMNSAPGLNSAMSMNSATKKKSAFGQKASQNNIFMED